MTFPLHPNKIKMDSVLSPAAYFEYKKKSGTFLDKIKGTAILCWPGATAEAWVSKQGGKFQKSMGFTYSTINKSNLIWGFGIGAPATAILVEELLALGVERIIGLGIAGALDRGLSPGDLVVCESSYRDEGTSYHYLAPEKSARADEGLLSKVTEQLSKQKIDFTVGTSWTTDCPYRETKEEIEHFAGLGVKTVEMEASALYAVAQTKGVPAVSLFVVSDLISSDGWQPHFHHKKVSAKVKQVLHGLLL